MQNIIGIKLHVSASMWTLINYRIYMNY